MERMKKKHINNEGSALVTVLIILFVSVLLIVGAQMMLSTFANNTLSINKSNQAYLNAKSSLNTICAYYEDEAVANHDDRIEELKTMSGDYTSAFQQSGTDVGSSKINITKKNVTYDDGKDYLEVKITATGESDGKEYELYKIIPICLDTETKIPYLKNAFTQTGGSNDLRFTNGADGPVFNKGTGVDGLKSSKLTDFVSNGSVGTYDGSNVEFKSISVRGYALLKQSEKVYGDVITGGWSMIGGTGRADVFGRVYSQSGVIIMNSGFVGDPTAVMDKDIVLSEGPVIITGSQNCLSFNNYYDPTIPPYGANVTELVMEADGITPVIGTITAPDVSSAICYGNLLAKGDVYISGRVKGNIYTNGNVKIAGGIVDGNIYAGGDVMLTNADNNNAATVNGSIYSKANIDVVNSTCAGTQNPNMVDIPELTSKIVPGTLSTTANEILDEAEKENEEPDAIIVPSYLH